MAKRGRPRLEDNALSRARVKVAETPEEACQLLEVGFEYVGNIHDEEVFRKRK